MIIITKRMDRKLIVEVLQDFIHEHLGPYERQQEAEYEEARVNHANALIREIDEIHGGPD